MSKLITTSLISAVDWLVESPASWKERAFNDLRRALARDYSEPMPEFVRQGLKFEKTVETLLSNEQLDIDKTELSDNFKEVLKICQGGYFQKKTKSFIDINGVEYCLYGKIDVFFPDKIIDIKTCKEYKGESKYLKTFQHRLYCHNERMKNFEYLVVALDENKEKEKVTLVKRIHTTIEDFIKNEEEIKTKIKEVIDFLSSDKELKDLYYNKFNLYD